MINNKVKPIFPSCTKKFSVKKKQLQPQTIDLDTVDKTAPLCFEKTCHLCSMAMNSGGANHDSLFMPPLEKDKIKMCNKQFIFTQN